MKRKLFKTASELIEGYKLPLPSNKAGRKAGTAAPQKVTLRARPLASGNVQLYLYSCTNGHASRKAISLIVPETDEATKARNSEAVRLAFARAGLENADTVRRAQGFEPARKSKILFVDYVGKIVERYTKSKTVDSWQAFKKHFEQYSNGRFLRVGDINKAELSNFCKYLKTAYTIKGKRKKLAEATQHLLYRKFIAAVNMARRDGLTEFNPCGSIETSEAPKAAASRREYLTKEELQKLFVTDCAAIGLKRAFIFCCFSGLRFSDASRLTWGDISKDENGFFIRLAMQKTHQIVTAYLPEIACNIVGVNETESHHPTEKVFKLGSNQWSNKLLKRWAQRAGIKKVLTFHVSRHTCATLLLNLGAPLEVVSAQLGHKSLSTTQIYAKLLNRTLSQQISKFDSLGFTDKEN